MDSVKVFVKNNWKYIIGAVIMTVLFYFMRLEYQEWKQHIKNQATKPAATTVLPPQKIETKTEIIREVAIQAPSQDGAVLQFLERQGKVIAIVNGKEVEVPNVSGNPDVKIGENGELRFSTMSTTRVDVTEMANAQARLLADKEMAEQAKAHETDMRKEKLSRNKERLFWIAGTIAGTYLLTQ